MIHLKFMSVLKINIYIKISVHEFEMHVRFKAPLTADSCLASINFFNLTKIIN